jgi:glycosyltransferase involved in cell wall biosynthesis
MLGDRVSFYGAVYDQDELKIHYDTAIAYVSPGHVGLGVLHSFAYGVPVITRRDRQHAPEVENIKDGITGVFYADGASQLSGVMLSLVREDAGRGLGSAAYKHYIEARSMHLMVERTVKAINYVYDSRRRRD